MKQLILFIACVPLIALLRPFMSPEEIPLHFIPLLLVLAGVLLKDIAVVAFVLIGGLLYDLLVPVNFGLTPLIWIFGILLVRSQQRLLIQHPWLYAYLMVFVVSFLYLITDKILYSINYGLPIASLEAWQHMLQTSLLNTLVLVAFRIGLDLRKKLLWYWNKRKYYEELDLTAYAAR